ncbi:hypothetical protein DWV16_14005 [Anaerotruncus sp. AF02-27]|uniref:hypothetical protein n=1 Tax=Anaerotruncus sp. AF02-27 TaxID=2292191 RepID=UPI000E4CBDA8|nr:hypothetical protein [Anaerotruncus sp. AF02-27]RGX54497.1 hypothetical protein DWV16_14005 [Anaerotruncus sp. AF02-27]
MLQRTFVVFLAILMLLFCAVRVTAQESMTLPPGGPRRVPMPLLEETLGNQFQWMAVTLPPEESKGVLFLDGQRLEPYRMISREEAGRLMFFAAPGVPVTIGVAAVPEPPREEILRIRCINRIL